MVGLNSSSRTLHLVTKHHDTQGLTSVSFATTLSQEAIHHPVTRHVKHCSMPGCAHHTPRQHVVCWHLYLTHNTLSLQNAHAHDTTARTLSLRKSRLIGQDSTQKYQLSGTTQQAIALSTRVHMQNQVMATKQQQIVQRFIPAATGKLSVPMKHASHSRC